MYVNISEYWRWSDGQMCSQGGWKWGNQSSSLTIFPRKLYFRKLLALVSSPSNAGKSRFLAEVIEMERNFLNTYRNFSLRGPLGVKYDSSSRMTEGSDLRIWSVVEEKPHF